MKQTLKILPGALTEIYTEEVVGLGSVFQDADGNEYRFVQSYEADVASLGILAQGMGLHFKDGDMEQVSKAGGNLNNFAGVCPVLTGTHGLIKDNEYFFIQTKGIVLALVVDGTADGAPLYAEATNATLTTLTDATAQVAIAVAEAANASGGTVLTSVHLLGIGA